MTRIRHPQSERGLDFYETPACAVEALLRVETLPLTLWEPAAGRGAIVKVLRAAGYTVIASDIVARDGLELDFVADFRSTVLPPPGCGGIVTNPPFYCSDEIVRHALDLVPRVYMLQQLRYLQAACRTDILEHRGLARVHVFRDRISGMHRDGWTGNRASPSMQFAWFVWDAAHVGPTILDHISSRAPRSESNSREGRKRAGAIRQITER